MFYTALSARSISKAIVRNAQELTKHFVYPTDYRLNNIMLVDAEVKLIDLDDYLTKVSMFPNSLLSYESITCLDATIKKFLDEYQSYFYGKAEVFDKLKRKNPSLNFTYRGIEKYIENKSIKHNYILITKNTNVNMYMNLLKNENYRIVYAYKNGSEIIENLNRLFSFGIKIYDVVEFEKIERYLNSTAYDECLEVLESKILEIHNCKTIVK